MSWVWLLASVCCEVAATLGLRIGQDGDKRRSKWRFIPIGLGYAAAFGCLRLTLDAGMPLGVAYGMWSALGIVSVALLSRLIWRDPLSRRMLAGIGLIICGVVMVELG
ncbi:SMR family transporter [Brevibacterium sp. 50QC2O2]|uniref:DMT family transporter n=1 Tax=Brevibacterium sp. 50QC2O2 TaxID=2968459 RepID=UPI00211D134B|nr:SMR family transporter [Brevibacterium sp. 50QC2O2]MCQ9387169.1 SMR family transporter [Brevibacterium sp. 50QC2O2]